MWDETFPSFFHYSRGYLRLFNDFPVGIVTATTATFNLRGILMTPVLVGSDEKYSQSPVLIRMTCRLRTKGIADGIDFCHAPVMPQL